AHILHLTVCTCRLKARSCTIVSGDSMIFSGEPLSLRCIIPDPYQASWGYLWFRGSVQLPQTGEIFQLWNANVKESGKYSCQGKKETDVGSIKTLRSLPYEIHVDGGFAILQLAKRPVLVGDALDLKCRLRGNAPVHETILYRDGIQVMVQSGSSLNFHLPHVTLEDEGRYSCRVSWDLSRRTHSVMSVPTLVLAKPVLEIDIDNAQLGQYKMNLICHVQYNAPAPAAPVNYYFYKNNNLLGPANSLNHMHVRKATGWQAKPQNLRVCPGDYFRKSCKGVNDIKFSPGVGNNLSSLFLTNHEMFLV
uniref:Ig-like domain-containing protein n=1 Tax=Poecilia reticulata TaxID=8081 RepID=A0A3P9MYW8_POERE